MSRYVIIDDELGIFVGATKGIGFWSKYGNAGGCWEVVTFETVKDAKAFIKSWRPPHDPDGFSYVKIPGSGKWATLAELAQAGLSDLTTQLLENVPVEGRA